MRLSRGVTATIGAVVLAVGTAQAAPAVAAPRANEGTPGWHWVNEGWEPAPQGDNTLPAARYCGTFDLELDSISDDVRSKVLSRWDNGTPKDTYYTGALTVRAENLSTGKAKDYDMGGDMLASNYSTGNPHIYQLFGPVGIGMPIGASKGLPASYYVVDGYHVLRFNADTTQRTLTVKLGSETDICAALR